LNVVVHVEKKKTDVFAKAYTFDKERIRHYPLPPPLNLFGVILANTASTTTNSHLSHALAHFFFVVNPTHGFLEDRVG